MRADRQTLLDGAAREAPGNTVEAAARVLRAGKNQVRAAFVARALNALARLATELDERSLSNDAPNGEYRILYLGDDAHCAFRETFGQSTGIRIVTA